MQTEQLVDLLVTLLAKLVIPLVALILVPKLVKLFAKWNAQIGAQMGESAYHLALSVAHDVVKSIEQAAERLGLDTNEKKKEFAIDSLLEICGRFGISLTCTQIDTLIESAVKSMKDAGTGGNKTYNLSTLSPSNMPDMSIDPRED